MDINAGNISVLNQEFSTAFNKRIATVDTLFQKFCMIIDSKSGGNLYARIKDLPGLREWFGQRVVHQLGLDGAYFVKNRTFEETIGLRREDVEDDQYGFFKEVIAQLGQEAAALPDRLVFELLQDGHKQKGLDGQYFFDRDHESYDNKGNKVSYSNILTPQDVPNSVGGPAWYLFCTKQALRPIVFQKRRAPKFTAKTNLNDGNVFMGNEFRYGVDMRCAAGYGFHQMAFKCSLKLTPDNLQTAMAAMENQYRQDGTPFKTRPDAIFVPTALQGDARRLLKSDLYLKFDESGKVLGTDSNPWIGALDLTDTAYLSSKVETA